MVRRLKLRRSNRAEPRDGYERKSAILGGAPRARRSGRLGRRWGAHHRQPRLVRFPRKCGSASVSRRGSSMHHAFGHLDYATQLRDGRSPYRAADRGAHPSRVRGRRNARGARTGDATKATAAPAERRCASRRLEGRTVAPSAGVFYRRGATFGQGSLQDRVRVRSSRAGRLPRDPQSVEADLALGASGGLVGDPQSDCDLVAVVGD
jgi:hypothetical protein